MEWELTCWNWPERKSMERTVYGYAVFFLLHLKKLEKESERGRKREILGLFYFSVPLKSERSVLCEGIGLFRNSFHGNQSFYFIYIHQGATVLSVRDFMPNFRPPSHEIDYLCPHKYKWCVTMTTQEYCLQGNQRQSLSILNTTVPEKNNKK